MVTVHHLNSSHSHVILWLMEELELDYKIVRHQRDPQTRRSPDSLRQNDPASKALTIEDHGWRHGRVHRRLSSICSKAMAPDGCVHSPIRPTPCASSSG